MTSVFIPIDYYAPAYRYGGPITSVSRIITLIENTFDVHVFTRDHDIDFQRRYPLNVSRNVWVSSCNHLIFYSSGFYILRLLAHLLFSHYDIIYLNSFFSSGSLLIYLLSFFGFLSRTSVLIAPRGELTKGALSIRPYKKRAFIYLFKLLPPESFSWHVSNAFELQELRSFVPRSRAVFISPDPVSAPNHSCEESPVINSVPVLVYASRVTPKKNLLHIIKALHEVSSPCIFNIHGAIQDQAYWQKCLRGLEALPTYIKWNYVGTYSPSDVSRIFCSSNLFLFPTLSENFGHAVYESVSNCCPVFVSPSTPWPSSPPAIQTLPTESVVAWTTAIDQFISSYPCNLPSVIESCASFSRTYYSASGQERLVLSMFESL